MIVTEYMESNEMPSITVSHCKHLIKYGREDLTSNDR